MTNVALVVGLIAVLILGLNTLFWTAVGIGRFMVGHLRPQRPTAAGQCFGTENVAVLIPAHNEEAVLYDSLMAASMLLPLSQIHVVSDGSSDRTVAIAEEFGVNVIDLNPNRGKAGALAYAIEHFELERRFGVMLLLDADTRLSPDYLKTGLPLFNEPGVVAVAGRVKCLWDPPPRTAMGRLLVSYRSRLYAVVQLLVKYGQAARWANVVSIVPGFASMYRTDILHQHRHHRRRTGHRRLQHDFRGPCKEAGPHRFSTELRRWPTPRIPIPGMTIATRFDAGHWVTGRRCAVTACDMSAGSGCR